MVILTMYRSTSTDSVARKAEHFHGSAPSILIPRAERATPGGEAAVKEAVRMSAGFR